MPRWRTCREIVDDYLARGMDAEFTRWMVGKFHRERWIAYDITGDESRKHVTARLNADRDAEGLPAIQGAETITYDQAAALGLVPTVEDDDEIPFDGRQPVIEDEPESVERAALIAGMAGAW